MSVTVPPDTETWVDAVTYGYHGERTDPFPDSLYVPGVQVDLSPTVASVAPATGLSTGGEEVTVAGALLFSVTAVTFGGAQASSVAGAADGASLTCITPPGAVGAVDVTVVTPGGEGTLAGGFTYTDPPPPE